MTDNGKKRGSGGDPFGDLRVGFDGLLSALGEAITEISDRLETGQSGQIHKSFEVDTGKGPIRAEAGVRVRFADGGGDGRRAGASGMSRPINTPPPAAARPRPSSEAPVRRIDFEIVEDKTSWRLTADIPGVERSELTLRREGDDLVMETTGARRFRGVALVPVTLDIDALEITLRNGIMELSGTLKAEGEG